MSSPPWKVMLKCLSRFWYVIFSTAEVKLKFDLTAGIVQRLFFNELDSSFVIQLPVLNISEDIHSPGPEYKFCISRISTAQLSNFGFPHSPELLRCLGHSCSQNFSCYSGHILDTTKIGWWNTTDVKCPIQWHLTNSTKWCQ